jgi:hypothetical protein
MSRPLSGRMLLCATLRHEAVAEWTVDADRGGPLVMGGQSSGIFSIGTYGSVTSYNDVGEDDFTLLSQVFFYNFLPSSGMNEQTVEESFVTYDDCIYVDKPRASVPALGLANCVLLHS